MMMIIFFFNDTATTEIYTLSLHDALPIYLIGGGEQDAPDVAVLGGGEDVEGAYDVGREDVCPGRSGRSGDRKSTRLNSSHANISYAVFCLKKKKTSIIYAYFTNNNSNPIR